MKVDHVRFYVEDAATSRDWLVQRLGFRALASGVNAQTQIEVVNAGSVYLVLCSALGVASPVAAFLQRHPPGVVDVAFQVEDVSATIAHALSQGAILQHPLQTATQPKGETGQLIWATIAAWGNLTHTFVQRSGTTPLLPGLSALRLPDAATPRYPSPFTAIDHIVLNVPQGQLQSAVDWYEGVLGFQPQQRFEIQTHYSGLCSRVMQHPLGFVQLPINEPTSATSQIQEFLDVNRGAGIQHIALATPNLVTTIAHLRQQGLPLLQVPATYYQQLRQRPGLPCAEAMLTAIADQQLLVDWQEHMDQSVLIQTFTQPIFEQPTFFFELIERQVSTVDGQIKQAQGFGEGNFRALFEAIEREQIKRGSIAAN